MSKEYHDSQRGPSLERLSLVALLYFAEGLPFGFVYVALPVFFRAQGVDLVKIGLLSLAGLCWTAKPLWAPLIDAFGRKCHWMILALAGSLVSLIFLAFLPLLGLLPLLLVFLLCFFSATFDIAADGYTIEILPAKEVGPANGVRVAAYRVALIVSGGALVALSGVVGSFLAILGLALLLGLILICVWFWSATRYSSPSRAGSSGFFELYKKPLLDLIQRPYSWALVPFVLLFKVGDAMMGAMIYPFWVDRGFSRAEIGLISGTLGTILSILGSLAGGWLVKILGLGRALWTLGAAQALSNLGYAYAALPSKGRVEVYLASAIESFTGGLGTAAFLAFLMRLCRRQMSASQYALLATLFSFSRAISGALSGFGASSWGYATFFFYTFWASLPAFFLLPWVLKSLPESSDSHLATKAHSR